MIENLFNQQFERKIKLKNSSVEVRIEKLNKIYNWIFINKKDIQTAIYNDFNKPSEETDLTEIYPVLSEIKYVRKNLNSWMKRQKVKKTLTLFTHSARIKYEAKGVVLIISPWNYPFLLTIGPLISAIAAGNTIILKPSEISVNTGELIEKMISELFSVNEIAVIQGGKDVVTKLLTLPFDHIFFTGSTKVGTVIAKAAAEHLTSSTLELGGKSPVIIERTANLKSAAEKIVWGKFINKGQTCVAPDYILVDKSVCKPFTKLIIEQLKLVYGESPEKIKNSSSYSRIINGFHHKRLIQMLDNSISNGSSIIYGGNHDYNDRFIEPTVILTNCKKCEISEDEIFGPLLPIIEYEKIENAIEWINSHNPALLLYIFSKDNKIVDLISNQTVSGGIGINDVVLQFSHQHLPFGGVKQSGIGRSHGYFGFTGFSNQRSYLESGGINFQKLIYPPYTDFKRKMIDFILKYL